MEEKQLLDANTFTEILSSTMRELKLSYIDAIVFICEKRNLDVEVVPELLTPKIKKLISAEAGDLNMLKKKKAKK